MASSGSLGRCRKWVQICSFIICYPDPKTKTGSHKIRYESKNMEIFQALVLSIFKELMKISIFVQWEYNLWLPKGWRQWPWLVWPHFGFWGQTQPWCALMTVITTRTLTCSLTTFHSPQVFPRFALFSFWTFWRYYPFDFHMISFDSSDLYRPSFLITIIFSSCSLLILLWPCSLSLSKSAQQWSSGQGRMTNLSLSL